MPEGPEVYALAHAIKSWGTECQSYGKHIFINNTDLSFGLKGHVVTINGQIAKKANHWMLGHEKPCNSLDILIQSNKLGLDFMTANKENLIEITSQWANSRKKLGALILDQSLIAGIGVAWGSEICHLAELRPDKTAREQNLSNLVPCMLGIRNYTQQLYVTLMLNGNLETNINAWFENLYAARYMKVYKVGTPIEVAGRTWWV